MKIENGKLYTYRQNYVLIEDILNALKENERYVTAYENSVALGSTTLDDIFSDNEVVEFFKNEHVVQTPYNKESKGIKRELEIAKEHGIPVLTCKEIES